MRCSSCPGLNRSYLACSLGLRHICFIDEEIDCRAGEALLRRGDEREEPRSPRAQRRPAQACAPAV